MCQSIFCRNNEVFTLWNAIKSCFMVCEAASILSSSNILLKPSVAGGEGLICSGQLSRGGISVKAQNDLIWGYT